MKPTTTITQDECVDANYDAIPYIVPKDAEPGSLVMVPQDPCIKAALRQWAVMTQ